jgi:predicted XRE-type DNA-binding protein
MARKRVRTSSGNVFRDLGFSKGDAENLRIRSELMIRIADLIEKRGMTQAAAARIFGVTQPRVSDLVRGRIGLFTIDALVNMLAKAGVRITFTARAGARGT